MTHYHCDNCNVNFTSNKKIPRCPDCNRVAYIIHKQIKPDKKTNYEVKKFRSGQI